MKTTKLTRRAKRSYPKTPECDKLAAVKDKSQIIGDFIAKAASQGIHLASYGKGLRRGDPEMLWPIGQSIEQTLADHFGINLFKVENERRAILDYLQS